MLKAQMSYADHRNVGAKVGAVVKYLVKVLRGEEQVPIVSGVVLSTGSSGKAILLRSATHDIHFTVQASDNTRDSAIELGYFDSKDDTSIYQNSYLVINSSKDEVVMWLPGSEDNITWLKIPYKLYEKISPECYFQESLISPECSAFRVMLDALGEGQNKNYGFFAYVQDGLNAYDFLVHNNIIPAIELQSNEDFE